MIEYLKFHPIKKQNDSSLIGFCSFKYNGQLSFNEIPVHKINQPVTRTRQVRLRYPDKVFPYNQSVQIDIDEEMTAYILKNYKECLNDTNKVSQ